VKTRWKYPLPFARFHGILDDGICAAEDQADRLPVSEPAFAWAFEQSAGPAWLIYVSLMQHRQSQKPSVVRVSGDLSAVGEFIHTRRFSGLVGSSVGGWYFGTSLVSKKSLDRLGRVWYTSMRRLFALALTACKPPQLLLLSVGDVVKSGN
jgi:hypothetical protein